MLDIKILGSGCSNCEKLYEVTRQALADLGLGAQMEKITDYQQMARYGVMATPALVIDERVVVMGKVPKAAEVISLLTTAAAAKG